MTRTFGVDARALDLNQHLAAPWCWNRRLDNLHVQGRLDNRLQHQQRSHTLFALARGLQMDRYFSPPRGGAPRLENEEKHTVWQLN
jgi:hypothetical protein